jgi:hypothetical protein
MTATATTGTYKVKKIKAGSFPLFRSLTIVGFYFLGTHTEPKRER